MKRRWLIYLLVGILFGAFDFFYLGFLYKIPWGRLFGDGPAGQTAGFLLSFVVLNVDIWLVPAVPVALAEARHSRSKLSSAAASVTVWCAAIVAYYLANAVLLGLIGLPGRPELHISNQASPGFWANWASVFRGSILGGITEWITVAVVGGAIVGFVTGLLYLRLEPAGAPAR